MWNLSIKLLPFALIALEPFLKWSQFFPLDPKATLTFFMMVWMVVWWIAEAVPMGVTALIPLVFLPVFGILNIKEVSPHYSNPMIYLFLGGFMIARALEKTKLNERIALSILGITGRSDRGIVIGFMIATAFLSMWISNTATTVMMVPIAIAVIDFLQNNLISKSKVNLKPLSVVILLSIAYSANIGGIVTPVGTPPNVVLLGYLDELFNTKIDFWKWMIIGFPVITVLLTFQYFLLTRLFHFNVPIDSSFLRFIKSRMRKLGPLVLAQKVTISIFLLTCVLWIFKDLIHRLAGLEFLNDTSIAILGGVLLFLSPGDGKTWKPVLDLKDIPSLPWNIVLLFGGGMAMAQSLKEAGLVQMTTHYFSTLQIQSPYLLVLLLAVLALTLTEIMSNVALCLVALPLMMKLGQSQGIDPILVGLPVAFCSSFAFSLPVSTPPNAIVFGTNQIRVKEMLRAGAILNFIAIFVVMTVGWGMMKFVLD